MHRLTDKLTVMLLSVTAFGFSGMDGESFALPVLGLLAAVASTSLVWLFSGTRTADWVILLSAFACLPFPMLFCAAPTLLYDSLSIKKPWLAIPALLALTRAGDFTAQQLLIIAVGTTVTFIFCLRVGSLEASNEKLAALRDDVEAKNLELKDKNVRLADAADNEIHLATLRERNRIAREIHDNVGNMLTRSLLQAGALMVINKDETLRQPLSDLKDTLNTAMTSIRESVHDLHDESVDLDTAVHECIRSVGDRFTVTYENDSEGEIPVKIRLCFIAVIKEGVSNAVKHSDGDTIHILVRQHPAFYQLTVEDNGSCPADRDLTGSGGIGLQNMRDRAEAVGGMITITPSPEGFRIFMTVRV